MGLDEGEALGRAERLVLEGVAAEAGHRLASDHLEPGPGAVPHEAAVHADVSRPVRGRHLVQVALTARPGPARPVRLLARGDGMQVPAHPFGRNRPIHRQHVAQHAGGQAVGDQGTPARLQVEQFRRGAPRQEVGKRAERGAVAGSMVGSRGIRLALGSSVYDPVDPMGKMFFNILATFAEFEADLIRLRTREGMAIARAKGRLRGKQPKLSDKQHRELRRMHDTGDYSITDLAELFSISRPTVYRTLKRQLSAAKPRQSVRPPSPHPLPTVCDGLLLLPVERHPLRAGLGTRLRDRCPANSIHPVPSHPAELTGRGLSRLNLLGDPTPARVGPDAAEDAGCPAR